MIFKNQQNAECIRLLKAGLTYGEIAKKLSITRNQVAGAAYRAGHKAGAARIRRGPLNVGCPKGYGGRAVKGTRPNGLKPVKGVGVSHGL